MLHVSCYSIASPNYRSLVLLSKGKSRHTTRGGAYSMVTTAGTVSPCRTKWVKVDGILYKPEGAVVLELIDDYPVFGKIQSIFVVDCVVFLHVCVIRTVSFNSHIHAYIVKRTPTLKTLPVRSLYSPTVLHIRRFTNNGS